MNFTLVFGLFLSSILAFGLHAKGEELWGIAALVAVLFLVALAFRFGSWWGQVDMRRRPWYTP